MFLFKRKQFYFSAILNKFSTVVRSKLSISSPVSKSSGYASPNYQGSHYESDISSFSDAVKDATNLDDLQALSRTLSSPRKTIQELIEDTHKLENLASNTVTEYGGLPGVCKDFFNQVRNLFTHFSDKSKEFGEEVAHRFSIELRADRFFEEYDTFNSAIQLYQQDSNYFPNFFTFFEGGVMDLMWQQYFSAFLNIYGGAQEVSMISVGFCVVLLAIYSRDYTVFKGLSHISSFRLWLRFVGKRFLDAFQDRLSRIVSNRLKTPSEAPTIAARQARPVELPQARAPTSIADLRANARVDSVWDRVIRSSTTLLWGNWTLKKIFIYTCGFGGITFTLYFGTPFIKTLLFPQRRGFFGGTLKSIYALFREFCKRISNKY